MMMDQADSTEAVLVVAHKEVGAPADALACDAIDVVLRRLSALPLSPQVEQLQLEAQDYLRQARDWQHSSRKSPEWDALMMRVLGLYAAVAKLEPRITAHARALS